MKKCLSLLLGILFLLNQAASQSISQKESGEKEGGVKYIINYHPVTYNQQPQNWDIVQDKRGLIYVANQGGLMEYDGVNWRLIEVRNQSVRSLAIDEKGRIYAGGYNELGYLTATPDGTLHYVSLLSYLPENCRDFADVWKIHTLKDQVYFRTTLYMFSWRNQEKQVQIWKPETEFSGSFTCGRELYIRQKNVGLMRLNGERGTWEKIRGGEAFGERKIFAMMPFKQTLTGDKKEKILIGTRDDGFFLLDAGGSGELVRFPTEADTYIKEHQLYRGINLEMSQGRFALATLLGGVVVIDTGGKIKDIFTGSSGLLDENVKTVFEDDRGNLWLGLNKGIARIEYGAAVSFYDNRTGLPGIVLSVTRHGDQLYVGTTSGLFVGENGQEFVGIKEITGNCWSLYSFGHRLWVAATNGLYELEGGAGGEIRRLTDVPAYVLYASERFQGYTWVGTAQGLSVLEHGVQGTGGQGRLRVFLKGKIRRPIRSLGEEEDGTLWAGTLTAGVCRVICPLGEARIEYYDESEGLCTQNLGISRVGKRVLFTTEKGLYNFDGEKKRFYQDDMLGKVFADGSHNVFVLVEDGLGVLWFHSGSRNYRLAKKEGPGKGEGGVKGEREGVGKGLEKGGVDPRDFLPVPQGQVNVIFPEGVVVWFGGRDGLMRFRSDSRELPASFFSILVRRVIVNGNKVVYNGYPGIPGYVGNEGERVKGGVREVELGEFEYQERNLRFEFAAPFFESEREMRYRWRLEGYEEEWSSWRKDTHKDYTNLDPGDYIFRVKAKNVYGRESEVLGVSFGVEAPWYQTIPAYGLYGLGFILLVHLLVRRRSQKLQREKVRLEEEVEARTREIHEKNRLLEEQTEQLQEQSHELQEMARVKSRFFANISHEFRTPLTLIIGPIEQLLDRLEEGGEGIGEGGLGRGELVEQLGVMLGNSRGLLILINELLELARLDSGRMELRASCHDLLEFLRGIMASFHLVVQRNRLELNFQGPAGPLLVYFDGEKLEKIVINLLFNAVKFTQPGGRIDVGVKLVKGDRGGDEMVEISVADTGVGIKPEHLEHIFDYFYQGEGEGYENKIKGTGIGLALARELVALHGGELGVKSREGAGTEFIIRLPMGTGHLEGGENIEWGEKGSCLSFLKGGQGEVEKEWEVMEQSIRKGCGGGNIDIEEKEWGTGEWGGEEGGLPVVLVIEDHVDMRGYIRRALEREYVVVEAGDGEKGLRMARTIMPGVIISDVMMPGMDGFELCRELKSNILTCHIPVILLTAKASEDNQVEGLSTGADDYIIKPFHTKILLTRIKNLLELRRQIQLKIQRQKRLLPGEIKVSSMDEEFLGELHEILEKNLSDPDFNIDRLCEKMYMGRTSLFKKIQALTGETPNQFIRSYRLQRAAQLLKGNFGNITEVAFAVGFSSSAYFTKCFKEKFHRLPSTFLVSEAEPLRGPVRDASFSGNFPGLL